jgi:Peptidase C39 family
MISIALIWAAVVAAPGENFDEKSMPAGYWRNPRRCGPNCLYGYLSIHGHPVKLRSVLERVPIGPDGANMGDLRKAATGLGVPSQVIKTTPGRLAGMPLPAIAHLETRDGHFVLVLRVTSETVMVADMMSGMTETLPADVFFERWSGYVLVPGTPGVMARWPLLSAALAAVAAILSLYLRPPARRRNEGGGS